MLRKWCGSHSSEGHREIYTEGREKLAQGHMKSGEATVCQNRKRKKKQLGRWSTDGSMTQSLTVSHLPLSDYMKPSSRPSPGTWACLSLKSTQPIDLYLVGIEQFCHFFAKWSIFLSNFHIFFCASAVSFFSSRHQVTCLAKKRSLG